MAKIDNKKSNDNYSLKGTMPPDKIKRFKLPPNLSNSLVDYTIGRDRVLVKKNVQDIKAYRQTVHGVYEKKLPASLLKTAHYMTIQHTRGDSDNPRDRKGLISVTTSASPVAVETETLS